MSILIVAPSGRVKHETLFDTPQFLLTFCKVIGRLLMVEEVKKAVTMALRNFKKTFHGFTLNPIYINSGKETIAWKPNAIKMVIIKSLNIE